MGSTGAEQKNIVEENRCGLCPGVDGKELLEEKIRQKVSNYLFQGLSFCIGKLRIDKQSYVRSNFFQYPDILKYFIVFLLPIFSENPVDQHDSFCIFYMAFFPRNKIKKVKIYIQVLNLHIFQTI